MKRLNKIVSVVTMTVLVHAALCVSILTILCDKVWYMRWTDAIPHRDTLSDVTYNVAMSYIASWVFFCLNVVYKGFRNSEKAKPIVRKICEILLNDSERLKEDLKQKQWTGDLHVENAEADIKSALSKIRPSKSSGTIMPGEHGTFFPGNYMEAWRLDVLSLGSMIDELRHYYNSAPQEFGILADEITTSNFFRLFRDVNLSKVGGGNLSGFAPCLLEYFLKIDAFKTYAESVYPGGLQPYSAQFLGSRPHRGQIADLIQLSSDMVVKEKPHSSGM